MIDAIGIANERVGQASEVDETVPIGVIAGEPRDLETEHKTHPCECYFGGEVSKARSPHRAVTGEAEILIDDNDSILRPTELTGLGRERILPLRRFAIVLDLSGARLTQIDDSRARTSIATIRAASSICCHGVVGGFVGVGLAGGSVRSKMARRNCIAAYLLWRRLSRPPQESVDDRAQVEQLIEPAEIAGKVRIGRSARRNFH